MNVMVGVLEGLQCSSGLFRASHKNVGTGYDKAWIRDTVYASFALENHDRERVETAYHAVFDVLLKHEYKIDYAVLEKPEHAFQYIHARYNPDSLDEFREEWGNKQNDAVGLFLFKVGELNSKGFNIIRDENDLRILQKLVYYLQSIKYWKDADNGVWEEWEEVHASSVGACLAGLKSVRRLVHVPDYLVEEGQRALNNLIPGESACKNVDLALLTLIYPFNVLSYDQAKAVLKNVEDNLVRERGVIRYVGDKYYNDGSEAEWHFGLSWLSIIYSLQGNGKKALSYFSRAKSCLVGDYAPELHLSGGVANENTPLAWSQSMFVLAGDFLSHSVKQ